MLNNDAHNVHQEIYFIIAVKTSVYCCLRSIGKSYFHVPLIESLNGLFPKIDIRGHASIEELRINTKNSVPLFENNGTTQKRKRLLLSRTILRLFFVAFQTLITLFFNRNLDVNGDISTVFTRTKPP